MPIRTAGIAEPIKTPLNPATMTPKPFNSMFNENLTEIGRQVTLWGQQFGNAVVSQYLFDVAFHQLYESEGYEFANGLLTKTRHALKRSEKSRGVTYPMRCIGDKQPDKWRKWSPQTLRKVDAKARQKRLHAKQDRIRIQKRTARGARLPQVGAA